MNKELLRMQMLSGIITESEYKAKLAEGPSSIPSKAEKISDKVIKWYEKHPNDKMKKLLNSVEKNLEKMLSKTTGENAIKVEEFEKMVKFRYPKPFEDPNYSIFKKSLNENFVGMGMVGNIFDREKTDYEIAFEHFTKGTSLNEYMEDEDEDENEFDLNQAFKDSPETASYDEVLDIVDSYGDYATLDAFQGTFSEDEEVSKKDYFKFFSNYIDDMSDVDYIKANWISIFDEDVYDKAGLNEAKKPGTFKQRSAMAKKARAGKDIGEKGKTFEKIAKSAGEKYGSEEAGKRVAGAVMYGKLNK